MNSKINYLYFIFYSLLPTLFLYTFENYTFINSSIYYKGTGANIQNNNLSLTKWNNIEIKYGYFEGKTIWNSDKSPIYGLTVLLNPGKHSTKTNYDGNFKIQLPYGKYKVDFYFLNHLLKTEYIIIESEFIQSQYTIPDLPNLTTLEVKSSI